MGFGQNTWREPAIRISIEFIDMEHTPKNILLRAVKKGKGNSDANDRKKGKAAEEINKCEQFLQADLTLGRLLSHKKGE